MEDIASQHDALPQADIDLAEQQEQERAEQERELAEGQELPLPLEGEPAEALDAAEIGLTSPGTDLDGNKMSTDERKLERERVAKAVEEDPNQGPTELAAKIW